MERLFAGPSERAPTEDVTYSSRKISKTFVKLSFFPKCSLRSKKLKNSEYTLLSNKKHAYLLSQVLPLPANSVSSKPLLLMDNVAVIVAKAWPVQIAVWDGDCGLQGPVPILYTEQPEQARSALEEDPDRFAADLNRFMAR